MLSKKAVNYSNRQWPIGIIPMTTSSNTIFSSLKKKAGVDQWPLDNYLQYINVSSGKSMFDVDAFVHNE